MPLEHSHEIRVFRQCNLRDGFKIIRQRLQRTLQEILIALSKPLHRRPRRLILLQMPQIPEMRNGILWLLLADAR